MKSKKVVNGCVLMFIMMMAAVFIIFLSGSTSFLISNFYSFDSAIFQVIGKGWSQGLIPYTQCFDHKGPLIFLIDAIGYGFGIGKNGIMIVQWVFMVCTMYIAYKTGKLLMKTGLSFLAMIFMWATMMITYSDGNMTEEYSLVFICMTMYFGIKYLIEYSKKEKVKHPVKYAFIYGISFMAMIFMRATNAVSVCTMVFLIICILVKNGQWKNILFNALAFIAGSMVVFIPFAIYFTIHNSLYEMLFGTVIYNFLYANGSTFELTKEVAYGLYFVVATVIISAVYTMYKRVDLVGIYSLFTSVVSLFMFLNINGYVHYYMISIPFIILDIYFVCELWHDSYEHKLKRCISFALMALLVFQIVIISKNVKNNITKFSEDKEYSKQYTELYNHFATMIPEDELADVLTFGDNTLSAWYLLSDRLPCFKYCFVQDWQSKNSETMTKENIDYLEGNFAKWIITAANPIDNEMIMKYNNDYKKIIEDKYEYVTSYTLKVYYRTYNLYRRTK